MFAFESLNVYQAARDLVQDIYRLLERFPTNEQFGLSSQLRRAVISITSNIAEGSGRVNPKDQAHFIEIAYASLLEVFCQLQIATDLGYIGNDDFSAIRLKIEPIAKQLSNLRKAFLQKNDNK